MIQSGMRRSTLQRALKSVGAVTANAGPYSRYNPPRYYLPENDDRDKPDSSPPAGYGCDKFLEAVETNPVIRRLVGKFDLKPVSEERLEEIEQGQRWRIVDTQSDWIWKGARYPLPPAKAKPQAFQRGCCERQRLPRYRTGVIDCHKDAKKS